MIQPMAMSQNSGTAASSALIIFPAVRVGDIRRSRHIERQEKLRRHYL